jgi:cob(I)alamin adenosyltransferase
MKIYTKTGDTGQTGLFAGPRVEKHHPRIEAYGAVDELNAALGVARAAEPPNDIDELLCQAQHDLFAMGAELATPDPAKVAAAILSDERITALESAIDRFEASLPPLREFILPGGSKAAAALHLARTVCRRAEREVSRLASTPGERLSSRPLIYLNRLGDLLFVLARAANQAAGCPDLPWRKP